MTDKSSLVYSVGGLCFSVEGERLCRGVGRLQGFEEFLVSEPLPQAPAFKVSEGDKGQTPKAKDRFLYGDESDGAEFRLYTSEGGHVMEMQRPSDGYRLNMWSDSGERVLYFLGDYHPQMLRFALWIGYGLMCSSLGRIAFHGSSVVADGRAYIFLGESGTGKSTHSRLWLENIEGVKLLNDDSPIVSLAEDGNGMVLYGSPWSGKTPCYKQECYPLGGCIRLSQAKQNRITKLSPLMAYAALHPSCPPEFALDGVLYEAECKTLDKLLKSVPVYQLECLPNGEAALLSYSALHGNDKGNL